MQAETPGFQAPEQLRGEDLDTSCDVYAFGVILTEHFADQPVWVNVAAYTHVYLVAHEGKMSQFVHISDLVYREL